MINIVLRDLFHVESVALEDRHHLGVFRQDIRFKSIDVIFPGDGGQPLDEFGADAFFLIGIQDDKRDFGCIWRCR